MALNPAKWEKARTLFESGLSLLEIQKETKIPKGSIGRKAAQDGWIKGKMRPLQNREVQATIELLDIKKEKATLNATEIATHDDLVKKRLAHLEFFDDAHVLVAQVTINKVKSDGEAASFQDLNAAANTISKAREGVLGKSPELVINNSNASQTVIHHTPEQLRRVNEDLENAC